MKNVLVLFLLVPWVAVADGERGIETLTTVSDLGEACEFYPHGNAEIQFDDPRHAYLAGLCVGYVRANVDIWIGIKYNVCGLLPGVALKPVFAAIRKTYRLRTLRDPDQEAMWFASNPSRLVQEAVFVEWEKRLTPSDCPRGSIDQQLSRTTENSP